MSTWEDQLASMFDAFVHEVAVRRRWQIITAERGGMGASRDYECGNLLLRVVNDRGIVNLEIGPSGVPDALRCASIYRDMLDPAPKGRWNLGLGGETKYVDENWEQLQELLAPEEWRTTLAEVDQNSRRLSPWLSNQTEST